MLREKTACFIGKRFQNFPKELLGETTSDSQYKVLLTEVIQNALEDGYQYFLFDMSTGVGIWATEILTALRQEWPTIHLEAATASDLKIAGWSFEAKQHFYALLESCDLVHFVQRKTIPGTQLIGNTFLVEQSSFAIALYDQRGGETGALLRYAKSKNLRTQQINIKQEQE